MNSSIKINLHDVEKKIVVLALFVLSTVNTIMLIVSCLLVIAYLLYKDNTNIGSVESLIFIAVRTIISPGLAIPIDSIGTIKWIIIMGLSLLNFLPSLAGIPLKSRSFIYSTIVFAALLLFHSIAFSSYPVVSCFKVFAWAFVFCAVMISVSKNSAFEWIDIIQWPITILIVIAPLSIVFGVGFLRNGHAFQGLTNQPNMFGVICSLCFAVNLYKNGKDQKISHILILIMSVVECYFTKSRTGMLTIVTCYLVHVLFGSFSLKRKVSITVLSILVIGALFYFGFGDPVQSFIYKGQTAGNVLYSRNQQMAKAIARFQNNKLFGSGFMVPLGYGQQSFLFTFDLVVEPGNLIYALLGDIGIVGTILFFLLFLRLYLETDKSVRVLFIMPIMASMGEMMFFSTNNIAVIYYLLYSICLTSKHNYSLEKKL